MEMSVPNFGFVINALFCVKSIPNAAHSIKTAFNKKI